MIWHVIEAVWESLVMPLINGFVSAVTRITQSEDFVERKWVASKCASHDALLAPLESAKGQQKTLARFLWSKRYAECMANLAWKNLIHDRTRLGVTLTGIVF